LTEFAYNGSVNRTTGLSPFEIVNGFKPRQPVDLILMAHHHSRVSDSASAFASHIRALHEDIREKIMKSNTDYKVSADLHRRLRTFNVGDYVMVRTVSSGIREEITRAKRRVLQDSQENQFKCLCGGSPTRLWHQLHF